MKATSHDSGQTLEVFRTWHDKGLNKDGSQKIGVAKWDERDMSYVVKYSVPVSESERARVSEVILDCILCYFASPEEREEYYSSLQSPLP